VLPIAGVLQTYDVAGNAFTVLADRIANTIFLSNIINRLIYKRVCGALEASLTVVKDGEDSWDMNTYINPTALFERSTWQDSSSGFLVHLAGTKGTITQPTELNQCTKYSRM
jgi:hypothetical protein